MRQAEVYANGVLAGTLTETEHGVYIFRYDDAFLLDKEQTAISLFRSFIICFRRGQIKPSNVRL